MDSKLGPRSKVVGDFYDDDGGHWTPRNAGVYRLIFEIDPLNEIDETRSANNMAYNRVVVHSLNPVNVDTSMKESGWFAAENCPAEGTCAL